MGISVNFTDVETSDFDVLPSGSYQARITDGEIRESGPNAKNPGSQYINWEFTISEGEFEGRKQWTNTSLLPQALFGLKGLLKATGQFDDDEIEGEMNFEIDDVIGSEVTIVVGQKMYDGEKRNEVKRVKPAGESKDSGSLMP